MLHCDNTQNVYTKRDFDRIYKLNYYMLHLSFLENVY